MNQGVFQKINNVDFSFKKENLILIKETTIYMSDYNLRLNEGMSLPVIVYHPNQTGKLYFSSRKL